MVRLTALFSAARTFRTFIVPLHATSDILVLERALHTPVRHRTHHFARCCPDNQAFRK